MSESNATALIPSQTLNAAAGVYTPPISVVVATTTATTATTDTTAKKKKNRRKAKKAQSPLPPPNGNASNVAQQQDQNENPPRPTTSTNTKKKNRNRGKGDNPNQPKDDDNLTSKKPPQARRKNNMKHPWRKHVPEGAMDPITLDPLVSLAYPPFALCAQAPFIPVEEWPPVQSLEPATPAKAAVLKDREAQILQQQWANISLQEPITETPSPTPAPRHYNLYDGRALAYYLVSQLQFIDPLNRRDLTRKELVSLDHYLARHGFDKKFKVVEAYDAKGVTVSTAGAAGNTTEGRATIMQQQAQQLLNSLFATGPILLQQQYQASSQQENNRTQQRNTAQQRRVEEDLGIYGDEGLLLIDDDINPGLRGTRLTHEVAGNTSWSARHIANQYSHSASVRESNFPPLAAPTTVAMSPVTAPPTIKAPPSKSLMRITKVITKTSAKELERQREAREAFVRRAQMSNLNYAGDGSIATPVSGGGASGLLLPPAVSIATPTEGQLLRNQALASALGVNVAPPTSKHNLLTGWARPTETSLDEFRNELVAANYPDSLIMKARDRMEFTVKMEKRWIKFLQDDKAASHPLPKMDRSTRVFVHEYSDFWKIHTESFDPEPKRYIHCVKLRDTSVPWPLLSDVAHKWRGPTTITKRVMELEHPVKQTAGQTPREFSPSPIERPPLPLLPRTLPLGFIAPPGTAIFDMDNSTTNSMEIHSRSHELLAGRERPVLKLAARTVESEVQQEQTKKENSLMEERLRQKVMREERERQEQDIQERERRALEAAFASDSEVGSLASHDSEEWEDIPDQVPQYIGSDQE